MNILLLSTADWDHPFWTNKQHVALELAKKGNNVMYVESLGIRQPSLSRKDRGRLLNRLKKLLFSPKRIRNGLWVISPLVIPGIQKGILKKINRLILNITIKYSYYKAGFKCDVLWTYSPATDHYISTSYFKKSIYHCVDDISEQPEMPKTQLDYIEQETARKVDHIVVTTKVLYLKLKDLCNSIHIMPNVVDYKHFSTPSILATKKAKFYLKEIKKPIIGFVGAISSYKLDFSLIANASEKNPAYSFVFIGSIGEGEHETDISILKKQKNIFLLGPISYKEIPGFIDLFDVAIIPSRKNAYTNAMFPMKFFEYLAAGIPIVAVEIPALIKYKKYASLCNEKDEFSNAIPNALKYSNNDSARELRQSLARKNTYETRTKAMLDLLGI